MRVTSHCLANKPVAVRLGVLLLALVLLAVLLVTRPANATEVERIVTPAGIELWYVQEPGIPVIALSIGFRGGSALDPPGKAGLASFALSLLDEGAGDLDSLAFQQAIVDRAIRLGGDAGRDLLSVQMRTLSKYRDDAFRLLGLALREPRFDSESVERVRKQILNVLAQDENDPETIAARTWFKDVFAAHPYAQPRDGLPGDIQAIAIDDLRGVYANRLARDNLILGASGDVAPSEIARLVDLALADLPVSSAADRVPEASLSLGGRTIVERMPLGQSVVSFGLPGLKRNDPDFYAAYVMNYVLGGGGFTSRLYEEVREKRGLAYSVYSYLYTLEHAGLYLGGVATRNDGVKESLDIIRAEIARLAEKGVSDEELNAAKKYLTGAFPLRLDNGAKIARMLVGMQFDNLGIDYIERRNGYMEAVTVEDIQRVARRLLDPDRLTVVVVGDPEGIEATP